MTKTVYIASSVQKYGTPEYETMQAYITELYPEEALLFARGMSLRLLLGEFTLGRTWVAKDRETED